MKKLQLTLAWGAKGILPTLLLLCFASVSGQIIQRRARVNNATTVLRRDPAVKLMARTNVTPADTVENLDVYLQTKADCEVTKSIDDQGNIFVRYPDGFTKKFSDGTVVEVTTPDGVRHVPKAGPPIMRPMLAVIQLPPPVPGVNDPIYQWLAKFRADLEKDIRDTTGGDKALWDQFLSNENEVCRNNIYKQIQFRAAFLENYAKAK